MTRKNAKLFGLLLLSILATVSGERSDAKTRSTSIGISPDYSELDLLGQVYGLILSQSVEVE